MILVLSGTKDGKEVAEKLKHNGFEVIASTVTNYGASLFGKEIKVFSGALDEIGMIDFINKNKVNIIIDATHPFAKEASINAINASLKASIKYIRYERQSADFRNAILAADFDEAVEKCKEFDNIFLTIGSKNLERFKPLWEVGKKVTARVLPSSNVLRKCEELGLASKDIIAMEGPFSTELNYIMFKEKEAEVIVTKESGITGGVVEKLEAASRLGICTILIKRPTINYPTIVDNFDNLMRELINDA